MAKPHGLCGTRGAHHCPVCCLCQSCNSPTHSCIHISFHMSLTACTFSTLGRSHRERRGQCYLGLGKGLEGELSFELGQERSTCVHQEGTRGGGEEGERQPGPVNSPSNSREERNSPIWASLSCCVWHLAALMGLLTQDGPNSASDLLGPASDWRERGDRRHRTHSAGDIKRGGFQPNHL